jgi:capsule polysaccharide export protein KpsC/LpsZ
LIFIFLTLFTYFFISACYKKKKKSSHISLFSIPTAAASIFGVYFMQVQRTLYVIYSSLWKRHHYCPYFKNGDSHTGELNNLSEDYAEVRLKSRDLTPESAPFLPIPLT